jgi:hypothetical protein
MALSLKTEGQYPMPEAFNAFLQQKVETISILVFEKYILASIPTQYDMVQTPGVMYSWFSWHGLLIPLRFILSGLTPLIPLIFREIPHLFLQEYYFFLQSRVFQQGKLHIR